MFCGKLPFGFHYKVLSLIAAADNFGKPLGDHTPLGSQGLF